MESLINNVSGLQPCNFIKETPTQLFSYKYCKISRNSFLYRATPLLYFEQLQRQILTVFLGICALWTISIFLTFFSDRVVRCSMEGASYCCFRKAVSSNFFQQVLLIIIISTYANLLQHFIFARFLSTKRRLWKVCTLKGDGYCLQFQTRIFRKSYWSIPLTLRVICLKILFLFTSCC